MSLKNELLQLSTLGASGLVVTKTSLVFPSEPSAQTWAQIGNDIYKRGESFTWWLADWAAFGEKKFGDLKEFCEVNEINYGRLRNLASISNSVNCHVRRDNLSFSHHAEVAALKPKDQKKFLDIASREKLSCADLRARIRKAGAEFGPEKTFGPPPAIFGVEKFWLDADVFLERNASTLNESKEYLWQKARPALEKMAKIWPDKITFTK